MLTQQYCFNIPNNTVLELRFLVQRSEDINLYELTQILTSLFKDIKMRKATKALLTTSITINYYNYYKEVTLQVRSKEFLVIEEQR